MFYNIQNVQLQRRVEPPARANEDTAGPLRALPCSVPYASLLADYTSTILLAHFSAGLPYKNTLYHLHNYAPAVNAIDFRKGR